MFSKIKQTSKQKLNDRSWFFPEKNISNLSFWPADRNIVPSAEEKVCQRQMRKKKNVVKIDRKAEAGAKQIQREGGEACRPCRAAGAEWELSQQGKRGWWALPALGRVSREGQHAGARLTAPLGMALLCCALGSQRHRWGHLYPPELEQELEE